MIVPPGALRAIVQRHEPRVWLLWAVGAAVLVATPFALADPAALTLLLDPELVAVIVTVGIALARTAVRDVVVRALATATGRPRRGQQP